MKLMKLAPPLAATAALALLATGASAQSAKFAATYDTQVRMVSVSVDGSDAGCVQLPGDNGIAGDDDDVTFCEATPGTFAEAEIASLHVANWKELLMGVSAQVNLVTFTQAKGKNGGGTSTAVAEGTIRVGTLVVPEDTGTVGMCNAAFAAYDSGAGNAFSAPGPVTFASRRQELSVTVDLDVVGAIDDSTVDDDLAAMLDIEGSVTVALGLDTTAAHHFNFVQANLSSGWYDVIACYDATALAEVGGMDIDVDTAAMSKVALGPRIITVQEVRATKDGIINETPSDP